MLFNNRVLVYNRVRHNQDSLNFKRGINKSLLLVPYILWTDSKTNWTEKDLTHSCADLKMRLFYTILIASPHCHWIRVECSDVKWSHLHLVVSCLQDCLSAGNVFTFNEELNDDLPSKKAFYFMFSATIIHRISCPYIVYIDLDEFGLN